MAQAKKKIIMSVRTFCCLTADEHEGEGKGGLFLTQNEESNEANSGTHDARESRNVQRIAKDICAKNLTNPVQDAIEGTGAQVKVGAVELGELVRVEGIGGEKHGKQKHNPGLAQNCLPETNKLALKSRVLHENDARTVLANDFA